MMKGRKSIYEAKRMSSNEYKRRNYFIKKNFQGKLILGFFLSMVVGCLIFVLALSWFASDTMTVIYSNNDIQIGETPLMLMKQMIAAQWVTMIVGGALVIVVATRITHHMAGPMFNLERSLDSMVDGKLDTVISLRKKDEGQGLAAKINQFNSNLSTSFTEIGKRSKNIEELLSSFSTLDPEKMNQEDRESIHAALLKENRAIGEIVNQYQLRDE